MTSIQPNKEKKFSWGLIALLGMPLIFGVVFLIASYNQIVNLEHEIKTSRAEVQNIQAENAESKDKIFNLLSAQNIEFLAAERKLVKEKDPEYIQAHKWAVASQY